MRRVIGFVTSRYGLAGLAALTVVVIVVAGRLLGLGGGSGDDAGRQFDAGGGASESVSPVPNDAPTAAPSKPDPVVAPGKDGPLRVATAFATEFLDTDRSADDWRAALRRYASPRLKGELDTMDKATMPAKHLTGKAKLADHGARWADVRLPTESGTMVFRLVSTDDVWQVDRLDWEPKR